MPEPLAGTAHSGGFGIKGGVPARSTLGHRRGSGAVALLEFLVAAAGAGIVAAYIFEGVAHRFLWGVVAVRAMHVTVVVLMMVIMAMVMVMVMVMVAVRAVHMGLLGHREYSAVEIGRNYLTLGPE